MKNQTVKITLPHSIDYLPISVQTVQIAARSSGFAKNNISKLEKATEEVVSNVIRFAYNKGEGSTFEMIIQIQTMGLLIIIKEDGRASKQGHENQKKPAIKQSVPDHIGLSSDIVKHLMDKVWIHRIGDDGQETHLFKYFENYNQHVKSIKETQESLELGTTSSTDKAVSYEVRRMRPKEAIDVSSLAYNAYSNTYLHTDVYYPDRVRELNKKNQLMSFIAITEDGEVIAHVAFERSTDVGILEIGVAFTKPKYRGAGCFNKLVSYSLTEAKTLGITGIFAQGVTSHPYSQKALNKFGFEDCALFLSIIHTLTFQDIERNKIQRESVMVSFCYLVLPGKMTIYPPGHHAEMIASLYQHIGFNPEIGSSDTITTPDIDKSVLSVATVPDNHTADITIKTYGKNILVEVQRVLRNLCQNQTSTIYLRMRLVDPLTAKYTAEFEKMGFFFAGILPRSSGNDEFILQYLNNFEIDFGQLKIASEKGKEILEYVKRCSKLS